MQFRAKVQTQGRCGTYNKGSPWGHFAPWDALKYPTMYRHLPASGPMSVIPGLRNPDLKVRGKT